MATGSCTLENLLGVFADNNAQQISAADMRLLINCIYGNFLDLMYVIDNLETYQSKQALSARAGAELNDKVEQNTQMIVELETSKVDESEVYTKAESDTKYYSQNYIDAEIYTKNETYNKSEIDNLIISIQTNFDQINARIDNIVYKNNLIE